MPRSLVRALTGVLALTAAAAVPPLLSPSEAVA
ncbi:serine protease, partial [Streptomyces sp. SID10362]|nr:serine protease [Streptomyces sp. SID10362]